MWERACSRSIVPTLRVGMTPRTLRVRLLGDAERPRLHSHAERRSDPPGSGHEKAPRFSRRRGCFHGYELIKQRQAARPYLETSRPA
ncbi:hypothetical protein CVG87_16485 [Pseudomonas sp. WCS365]|nr:hypothetical protein CVG87_16485 [Pseudomonas sp. WCS365]